MSQHPEDVEFEKQGRAEVAQFGNAIVRTYAVKLEELMLTYADREAETLFWKLRERFYALDLPNAVAAAKARSKP